MTAFDDELASRDNEPNFFIRFASIAGKQYCVHPVLSPSRTNVQALDVPTGIQQRLSPLQNRATVGQVSFRLVDVLTGSLREATDLVADVASGAPLTSLLNEKVTVFAGYQDIAESLYVQRFTGEVREVAMVAPQVYELVIVSPTRKWEAPCFEGLTDILRIEPAQAALAGATTMVVRPGVEDLALSTPYLLYRKDGSQVEQVTLSAKDPATDTITFTDGLQYTWGDQVNGGDILTDAPFIRGNLVNVYYSLLTGTFLGDGEDFPLNMIVNSTYLNGAGMVDADIDLDSLKYLRDQVLGDFQVDLLGNAEVTFRTLFEREFYPLGFFPVERGDGKHGIRGFIPPGPEVATPTALTTDHMVSFPRWSRKYLEHYNAIRVTGDADLTKSEQVELAYLEDATNQTNTKETGLLEIKSQLLRSGLEGDEIAEEIAYRHLQRWAVPPIVLEVDVILTKSGLAVGDIVSVTHPDVPDIEAGTVGLTAVDFEVLRVSVNYDRGVVELDLQRSAYTGKRFAWLGPDPMTDYGSATAGEKEFAYWGDASNQVNSGAEDGYYFY